jgi:hypothetical protein
MPHSPSRCFLAIFTSALLCVTGACDEEKPTPSASSPERGTSGRPHLIAAAEAPSTPEVSSTRWRGESVAQRLRGMSGDELNGDGDPSSEWYFPVFEAGMLASAGEVDLHNRYASTVMVAAEIPLINETCSGVLLAPRLVLTAAHCVCMRQRVLSPEGREEFLFDSSACAMRAAITAVSYEPTKDPLSPTQRFRHQEGWVRPHPQFKLRLDDQTSILSSNANLAVIFLDQPLEVPSPPISLAATEAQANEYLFMAGYGSGGHLGSIHGIRYFRRNKVTGISKSTREDVLYEQEGAYVYDGFNGGPCFRESGKGHSLVGITSMGSPRTLSFTSVSFHGSWLRAELQRAAHKDRP